eukprot:TRINITY_DN3765_c0_g1_i4.p1 TRINITY_DN3765_c0_g1~~TRINITY_DN3765_c0_g1_i4.p1  ORF type:complete len:227 (+),score=49.06 TRINITY_DN3765_c0_g1_i4:103-783(+)
MIRRPPRSTHCISSAASDVYKRQYQRRVHGINCMFERNAYAIGEKAKIFCKIDNSQCQVPVTSVIARLVNKVTYIASTGNTMVHKFDRITQNFEGCGAGSQLNKEATIDIKQGNKKDNKIFPTATGKCVQSQYFLQIEASVDASCTCCGTLPIVQIPVLLYPEAAPAIQFQFPSLWQPQQMPVFNIPVQGLNASINIQMGQQPQMNTANISFEMNLNQGLIQNQVL